MSVDIVYIPFWSSIFVKLAAAILVLGIVAAIAIWWSKKSRADAVIVGLFPPLLIVLFVGIVNLSGNDFLIAYPQTQTAAEKSYGVEIDDWYIPRQGATSDVWVIEEDGSRNKAVLAREGDALSLYRAESDSRLVPWENSTDRS